MKVTRHTTRVKEASEVDGGTYHFVDEDKFLDMVRDGRFIEYQRYVPTGYYGTSLDSVLRVLSVGKVPVLDLDPNASLKLRNILISNGLNFTEIFLTPVSPQSLSSTEGREEALRILRDRMLKRARASDRLKGGLEGRIKQAEEWFSDLHPDAILVHNAEGLIDNSIEAALKVIRRVLNPIDEINLDNLDLEP